MRSTPVTAGRRRRDAVVMGRGGAVARTHTARRGDGEGGRARDGAKCTRVAGRPTARDALLFLIVAAAVGGLCSNVR